MVNKNKYGIEARYRSILGVSLTLSGDWDPIRRHYGVQSANASALLSAHQQAQDEMEHRAESFCGTIEMDGVVYQVRSIKPGHRYPVIVVYLP